MCTITNRWPEKPVVITADDGFYNNSYYLIPLLEKYDMNATVSVVGYYSEYISVNDPHVPEYSYLTWEDIKDMNKAGEIEFGNHTYNMHSNDNRKGCAKLSYETEEEYAEMFNNDIGLMQSLMKINTGITRCFCISFWVHFKRKRASFKESWIFCGIKLL